MRISIGVRCGLEFQNEPKKFREKKLSSRQWKPDATLALANLNTVWRVESSSVLFHNHGEFPANMVVGSFALHFSHWWVGIQNFKVTLNDIEQLNEMLQWMQAAQFQKEIQHRHRMSWRPALPQERFDKLLILLIIKWKPGEFEYNKNKIDFSVEIKLEIFRLFSWFSGK
jgi:hypothetical protein